MLLAALLLATHALAQSPPGTVGTITVTRTDGTLTASWDAPTNAAAYHVTYSTNHGASWSLGAMHHIQTTWTLDNADNSATYVVGVRARNSANVWSGWRNSPSSGPYTPQPDPQPPAAPAGLAATAGDDSVTVTWTDPGDSSITGYEYQYRYAGVAWSAWTAVSGSGADTTSFTLDGLTNGTEYRVKLRAINDAGEGRAAPVGAPWYVAATPAAPTLAVANPTADGGTITLSNYSGEWYYRTEGASGGASAQSVTCNGPVNGGETTISGLDPNTQYTITAYAECAAAAIASGNLFTAAQDPGITLSPTALTMIEQDGTTYSYTVKLATAPTANVKVTICEGGRLTCLPDKLFSTASQLNFSPQDYATAKPVYLVTKGDADRDDDSVTIAHTATSSDTNYDGKSATLSVTIRDDDVTPTLSAATVALTEGGAGTYTVVLPSEPIGSVTVAVTSDDTDAVTVQPASLTFTTSNYTTPQTVTLTPVEDADIADESVTITHDAAGGRYDGNSVTLAVTVADDDPVITLSKPAVALNEGGGSTGTYTVRLLTAPTGTVTVAVASGDTGVVTVLPASLTFTTTTYATPQTVTVTLVADADGDESVTVTHTASGGGYDGKRATLRVTATTAPSFGNATIAPLAFTMGGPIRSVTFPAATGGRAPLRYVLTRDPYGALPPGDPRRSPAYDWYGLSFDADTRTLSGTPTRATDAMGGIHDLFVLDADEDHAKLTFKITITYRAVVRCRHADDGATDPGPPCGRLVVQADGAGRGLHGRRLGRVGESRRPDGGDDLHLQGLPVGGLRR